MECNDPDFVWTLKPSKDPTFGMNEEEMDRVYDTLDKVRDLKDEEYYEVLDQVQHLRCHPEIGYSLVEACKKAGWIRETHGGVWSWLVHKMAELLESKEPVTA